jgi:hypothetical protein
MRYVIYIDDQANCATLISALQIGFFSAARIEVRLRVQLTFIYFLI